MRRGLDHCGDRRLELGKLDGNGLGTFGPTVSKLPDETTVETGVKSCGSRIIEGMRKAGISKWVN